MFLDLFMGSTLLFHDIIECLIEALEAKDHYTKGHSTRVADMTYEIAKRMGIRGKELRDIHIAAHLHDIGKIGIPDKILNKKGKLLPHEFDSIKKHPEMGFRIIGRSRRLKNIAKIVLHHHERWDGKGYPYGLKEESIPIGSRIIALCDTVDAMTSERPYRQPVSNEECIKEIEKNKGLQFDPLIVEVWLKWKRSHL